MCDKCYGGYFPNSEGKCQNCYYRDISGGRCYVCSVNETEYDHCYCYGGYVKIVIRNVIIVAVDAHHAYMIIKLEVLNA